jgi:hypothetical protein
VDCLDRLLICLLVTKPEEYQTVTDTSHAIGFGATAGISLVLFICYVPLYYVKL